MPPNSQSHHHHQNGNPKRNPNPTILSFVLKSIVMLLVISSFFLFLAIASLALFHLLLSHRRPGKTHRRTICLPEFSYKEETKTKTALDFCAVCLEEYREGEMCRKLPGCCHVYHSWCIDRWLVKVPNCPVCRTPVRLVVSGLGSGVCDQSKVLWG